MHVNAREDALGVAQSNLAAALTVEYSCSNCVSRVELDTGVNQLQANEMVGVDLNGSVSCLCIYYGGVDGCVLTAVTSVEVLPVRSSRSLGSYHD